MGPWSGCATTTATSQCHPRVVPECPNVDRSNCTAHARPQATGTGEFSGGYNFSYTHLMKTAISVPDEIFEEAERLARQRGMSRSELYAKAVAEYVKGERFVGVRERLDAVY